LKASGPYISASIVVYWGLKMTGTLKYLDPGLLLGCPALRCSSNSDDEASGEKKVSKCPVNHSGGSSSSSQTGGKCPVDHSGGKTKESSDKTVTHSAQFMNRLSMGMFERFGGDEGGEKPPTQSGIAGSAIGLQAAGMAASGATKKSKCPMAFLADFVRIPLLPFLFLGRTVTCVGGSIAGAISGKPAAKPRPTAREIMQRQHKVTIDEKGARGQLMQTRLYMQMLVLEHVPLDETANGSSSLGPQDLYTSLSLALQAAGAPHVIYEDVQKTKP